MVDFLLWLKSWFVTLVLGRQWISKYIWVRIQFYVFLCAWILWAFFCPLFLSIDWHFACQCVETKINGTTIWGIVLEVIISASTLNHSGESELDSSSICPKVFIHIELKITSDREYFLVEVFMLLSLVIFGPYGIVSIVVNLNSTSSVTIFLALHNPGDIVWLVVESNHFYLILVHSTVGAQFRLYIWWHSEVFYTSTISILVSKIPCTLGHDLFVIF